MTRLSDYQSLAHPVERDACGVGFVADLYGRKTRHPLDLALTALGNLTHRGAVSADGRTGDGAGVLTQIPHRLFRRELKARNIALDRDEDLGVGVFFITNDGPVSHMYELIEQVILESPLKLLCWRDVPTGDDALGAEARRRRPVLKQVLVARPNGLDQDAFERLLYLTRKRIETRLKVADLGRYYVPSFSSRTISYKGLMVADQLASFYSDLADPDYHTAITVFHQRYSTNTMPRWSLAQPFRYLAHNGEINTLQGNVNFMRAREPVLKGVWGSDIKDLLPVIEPGGSDSAALDNAFELLVQSGRDPVHALMMLVPEAFEENSHLEAQVKGFYDYHASLMEPWDGPAALALTDGRYAVAGLDRNGLRPQRYWLTNDGTVVVGSEAGMIPGIEATVTEKGRLGPGAILAVDTVEHRLMRNPDIKQEYAARKPYRQWVDRFELKPEPEVDVSQQLRWDEESLARNQKLFGYHQEDVERIFEPMVFDGDIPVGSMGDDTPLAILSQQPQQLYRYFKQRFAQVTNPPIDPLRERLVMALETVVGPRCSILEEEERAAAVIKFRSPVISEQELRWLREQSRYAPRTLATHFDVKHGPEGLPTALEALCDDAAQAVRDGAGFIILSDRDTGAEQVPIPMLLAGSAVHHRLLREGLRTRTSLVLETGEPREDHHIACLIGFGAALIHPYLALATAREMPSRAKREGDMSPEQAAANYKKALEKGLLKIMSKMGISAISSYRGAQIFEAIGVDKDVIERYFTGTPSRIGGAGLETFARDALELHAEAFGPDPSLIDRGIYRFRKAGEYHAFNPLVFKALHKAVRTESFDAFKQYTRLVDERPACNLRDLLDYRRAARPMPLNEVEDVSAIVSRFTTQAMSHGSVSRETHETLAVAMNRLTAKSNSGEGGEDPARYRPYDHDRRDASLAPWHPKAGDWGNSAIKQVASGRFGVTPDYLVSAQELEIKMAQGSKPGEGGQIPGHKVSGEIARIRKSVPGVTLISPPPHHDIYSIEDLAQLIFDLKRINGSARVGVKLVSTAGVGTIAAGVAKGYADNIQISGHDGGTGASPLSSVKHAGVPWELGLSETQQVLIENNLRGRVTLRVDGGLKTGRDVAIAALLGAEQFGFGTAALVAAGCAMIRQCHLNTCPVGIATQRQDLRAKYPGEPEHVINFMTYVAQQIRMILAEMGFATLAEIVGRTDLLERKDVELAKTASLDLGAILQDPDPTKTRARRSQQPRNDRPEPAPLLDDIVATDCAAAVRSVEKISRHYAITNRERSVGARLSGEIARAHNDSGLPPGTIRLKFTGAAGQSFGLFNNRGVTLELEGEAQDYVGKGMYGGEIIVKPPSGATRPTNSNVIIGNTVLYGATGGALYAAGIAGERLAVRNSGAMAVIEGCGDHGCEYMTGGVIVVLGSTGRNFGAGMSGGIAFVYDPDSSLASNLNPAMVRLEAISHDVDEALLKALIARHAEVTGSRYAGKLLRGWNETLRHFRKVAPHPGVEDAGAEEQDERAIELAALQALEREWEGLRLAS